MKTSLFLGTLIALLLGSSPAWAHPPDSIAVSYDSTRMLNIEVHHAVKGDITKHYIGQIVVALNDQEVIRQDFKSQTDKDWQQVVYTVIDLKPGDKVKVTANCSVFGTYSQTFEPLPAAGGGK